jgi:gliding motility-associated-like protein
MTVTVIDNEAPVITCPQDLVLCDTEPVELGQATATDNCDPNPVITNDAPATFPVGVTYVTWTAVDIHGNSSTCVQTVTIIAHPTADAGPDDIICQAYNYTVSGASATNYSSILWTHNGQGTLQNANTLTPTYVPQVGETGNITLTLTVYANSPCEDATDQMVLTILPQPVATAGDNDTICGGETFVPVTAWASNYIGLLWTTSGTGTFDNPAILHPVYTPSQADINNGSVILTLTAYGSGPCGDISSSMTLTIIPSPEANAGNDDATCEGMPYTVSGATASNYVSLLWTHNGAGTLTNATTLTPTYTPAANETGTVVLTLIVTGNGNCGEATDEMILTINVGPTAYAGDDDITCASTPYYLGNATASTDDVTWTTSGTGTFDNASLLYATYTPSAADIAAGTVTLTLHVNGIAPCQPATDNMVLTIQPATYANAGENSPICNDVPYTVEDASATGYTAILWSHNGQGTLTDETTLTPTYTPAANETGVVTLTLTVTGIEPCGNATATVELTLQPALIANAGPDLYTCESTPIVINQAVAQNYSSVLWTTSGTGTFDDASLVNPTYTPSTADIEAGTVTLTMSLTGLAPCGDIEDQLVLTVNQSPIAAAGPDESACEGAPYSISGATASNYSTIQWTSNGTGVLTDANTLTPTYTPGAGETGIVVLTLTVNGPGACGNLIATDQMNLSIFAAPNVDAGADQTIAYNTSTTLSGSATGGSELYGWSWQPSELLVNPNQAGTSTNAITETTTFTLTVMDMSSGCSASDEVIITIGSINHPPVAVDDYDTTSIDEPITINILENDSDPDGDQITPTILTQPEHGTVILNADSTVTYTPAAGFFGIDAFTYMICDDGQPSLCDTATVRIIIFGAREDLIFYNGISPNGDGLNDRWIIGNIEYFHDNEVLIFNRWGDIVYSCFYYDNKNVVWDGKYDKTGNPVPDGTYFYIVTVPGVGKFNGWILVRGNK